MKFTHIYNIASTESRLHLLRYVCFLLLLLIGNNILASNPQRKLDSLTTLLKKDKDDTLKVKHLDGICGLYYRMGNSKALNLYADTMLALSQKLNYQRGVSSAYINYGNAYLNEGNYDSALAYEHRALKINKEIGYTAGIVTAIGNIGNIYQQKGDYSKALEYFAEALRTCEEINDKNGQAVNSNNIGIIYAEQGDYPKSLDYFLRALKIDQEMGDKVNMAMATGNIGIIYSRMGDYKKSLSTYMDALKLNEELGDKNGIAVNKGNIGAIYNHLDEHDKALDYLKQALAIAEEINNKYLQMNNLTNLGTTYRDLNSKDTSYMTYFYKAMSIANETGSKGVEVKILATVGESYSDQKNYKKAIPYLSMALKKGLEIGDEESSEQLYHDLSKAYSEMGDWRNAYEMYVKSAILKDSLLNQQKTREIGKMEAKADYDRQLAVQKADDDKKTAIADEQSKRQKILIILIAAIALAVAVIALLISRSLKTAREQKLLIEQKNKEVVDSINYAKRIQQALFKEEEYVTLHLPEHFIYFKPRDIVSGDFYWGFEKENYWYIAAVDCTGHGVPGAFLTMLGSAFLNEICGSTELLTPAQILNQLRDKIVKELSGHGAVKDGMDMSLCRINTQTKEVQWAGANNPLWYVQQGTLKEIGGDKQPIGYQEGSKLFTNHTIQLQKNDILYLFTDGYADQFGGPKGKKFKYKQFQDTLIAISQSSMKEQKEKLNSTFENWKGNLEQVDDVLVIGVRI